MVKSTAKYLKIVVSMALGALLVVSFLVAGLGHIKMSSAEQLRQITGAPAKMVWMRQVYYGAKDIFGRADRFQLVGLDTEDRRGERIILYEISNYNKPMFTASGDRIVFSDLPADKIYVVNWDGSGLQELSDGRAVEVWMDPQTGIEWIYRIPMSLALGDSNATKPLTRFRLDHPLVQEMIWDRTTVNPDNIQLPADGSLICGQFPWPEVGFIEPELQTFTSIGTGCWPSSAPDNSHLMWIFDGPHRNLLFHSTDKSRKWSVNISAAPGVDGYETYHPRWSNHARFMCMTGPYYHGILGGGGAVSIFAGRFNAQMTEVEAWVRVSANKSADFFPDFWIKPGSGDYDRLDVDVVGGRAADIDAQRLIVKATLLEKTPVPTMKEIAPYTKTLVVYRYQVDEILAGQYNRSELLVAHWGLVDGKETAPQMAIGEGVRLELDPYASRSDLEGERVVMELSKMSDPLFYNVEGK